MIHDDEIKPLLQEIRDIVLRQEQVNRKEAGFRKRILIVLMVVLAAAVLSMGYALMLLHSTIKELRQQQHQQHEKVASLDRPRFDLMGDLRCATGSFPKSTTAV